MVFDENSFDKFKSDQFEDFIKKNDAIKFGYDVYGTLKTGGTIVDIVISITCTAIFIKLIRMGTTNGRVFI